MEDVTMVRTIEEQTGWRRPGEYALCQDPDVLRRVTEFDYDIEDPGYVVYFIERTGYSIIECDCAGECGCWDEVCTRWANPCYVLRSSEDLPWILTRARMQDAWQLYCQDGST